MPPTAEVEKEGLEKEAPQGLRKMPKGMTVDYYGPGGVVEYVKVDKVEFLRDVGPMFESSINMFLVQLFYFLTGNYAIPFFFGMFKIPYRWWNDTEKLKDHRNISAKNEKEFYTDKRFWIPMFACVAMGTFNWLWCICLHSDDVKFQSYWLTALRPKTWPQFAMMFFALGFMSSMETSCAHELIHRREGFAKMLDVHVQVHHKIMCTPEDPFFGKKNESFYAFMVKELYSTYTQQLQSEFTRIKKKHGSDCPWIAYVVFNKMFWYFMIHVFQCGAIYLLLGKNSLKYHFIHAFWGYWFLGYANYVTHYGLKRNKDKNGMYESINKYHSWNFTSTLLFWRLPRHSDHHNASFRPVQIVRRMDDAPWIPYQFSMMFFLVHVPPLWYWVMNPRCDAVNDTNSGKPNNLVRINLIQPRTERDKKTDKVVYTYFMFFVFLFFYCAFISRATTVPAYFGHDSLGHM